MDTDPRAISKTHPALFEDQEQQILHRFDYIVGKCPCTVEQLLSLCALASKLTLMGIDLNDFQRAALHDINERRAKWGGNSLDMQGDPIDE